MGSEMCIRDRYKGIGGSSIFDAACTSAMGVLGALCARRRITVRCMAEPFTSVRRRLHVGKIRSPLARRVCSASSMSNNTLDPTALPTLRERIFDVLKDADLSVVSAKKIRVALAELPEGS